MIQGSLTLHQTAPLGYYEGRWESGLDYFELWFEYDQVPPTARAGAVWTAGPNPDMGDFPLAKITPPPNLLYRTAQVEAFNWPWFTRLLVTS